MAELKYSSQQQGLFAIVNALAAFRIYCLDRPVMIETDHKSLEHIFQLKMANRRLARWYDKLAEYQPVFANLIKTIIEGHKKDKIIQQIRRVIERRRDGSTSRDVSETQYKAYLVEINLVWYQGSTDVKPRIVVPNILNLKHKIIAEVHGSIYGGHPGSDRMCLKLQTDWQWPRMIRTIKKYIADCEDCRRNKSRLSKTPGLMKPLQIPDERWRSISIDFITDLPDTKRANNFIWVVVD
ncbi:unnamed protein product [Phytophthora fragariaefolia]|uniref:Unnamed protein product n=1 Tax=Phytophthora fragariaefolia TaxID=1490495 RepID=A0A9W6Y1T1_9STRA|nr:unnamed protein product [Phytophthora fragariaefolia]